MLGRADREAGVVEIEIFAANAKSAAGRARAARIRNELEAQHARREFAFDDLDGRDLGVGLIDRRAGGAVLARARAGAAAKDFILHIALPRASAAPADDDRAAAAGIRPRLGGHDVHQRGEYRLDRRVHGGIVGVDRRGKTRVHDRPLARDDIERAHEAAVDEDMRINQRDQAIGDRGLRQRRTDIRRADRLIVAAGEVEGDLVALFLDDDMNAHGLIEPHAVVVDETLGLVAPVAPFGDGHAHAALGQRHQMLETRQRDGRAHLVEQLAQPLFAKARAAKLSANVAEHEFRRPAVGGDDALDLDHALETALIAHRRQVEPLVEGFLRLSRARAGHGTANVALVRDGGAETHERASVERGRDHAHVRRVRAAALVGRVDQEGVALGDVVVGPQDRRAAGGKRPDVQWQHNVLRDDLAARVEQRAGGVLAFAHNG